MYKRILVIADELAIRKSFVLTLEDIDCQVDTTETGEKGLKKVSNNEYDLIFLDLRMPGINGVETLIRLRNMGHKMPIYIVTAFHEDFTDQLRIAADKEYEFEIMQKPIESQDLVRVTKGILERAGAY